MAGPWERFQQQPAAPALSTGQLEAGNIDLGNRPKVRNPDGSISTVRSMSANFDGQEVLLPTVSDDGRLLSDNEAIAQYQRTGRHLGKFSSPDAATSYAEQLHRDQEALYAPQGPQGGTPAPAASAPAADGPWARFQAPQGAPANPRAGMTMEERYAAQGINPNQYNGTTGGSQLNIAGFNTGIDTPQWLDRTLSGAGKSVADTAQGIGQLFGGVDQATVDERKRLDAPLMATGAGMAGNVGGQVAQMAIPVGGGARLASYAGRATPFISSAARGAAFAGLQPMATGQDRLTETAIGGALGAAGQGVASGLSRLARGVRPTLDKASGQLADAARAAGIRLGVGNLSENPMVRTVASQLERLPFSGGVGRAQRNQEAFNRAVGETFGLQDARQITPELFARAKRQLGNGFNFLTGRNNLVMQPNHVAQIRALQDEARRLAGTDTGRALNGWVDELLSKVDQNGQIPGRAYQSIDSRLGKAMKPGGELSHYLGEFRNVVRDAMDNSISYFDRKAWDVLRRRYANLKTVEPLVAKAPTGNISPASLMGRVTADNAGKVRMATDNGGRLGELARIGQRYLKEPPNSGTADRLLANSILPLGVLGAQGAGWITPEQAAYTGAALLGNRVATRALASEALAYGGGRFLSSLARLAKPAPRALPALGRAAREPAPLEITIAGGTPGVPVRAEELERLRAGQR